MLGPLTGQTVVDVVLAIVALEAVGLWAFRRWTGRGPAPADVVATLAAGAFLLLALRAALGEAGETWVPVFLAASLLAHLADIARRWRHPRLRRR